MDNARLHGHDLLTPPEVLDYLRITGRTLYRLIHAGPVPAVRVGRQWRVRRADLDDWLQRQAAGASLGPAPASGTHTGDGTHQLCVRPVTVGGLKPGVRR